jgi:hypothetical protein
VLHRKDEAKLVEIIGKTFNFKLAASLNPLGEGTGRKVFLLDTYRVIKIAYSEEGSLANQEEVETYFALRGKKLKVELPFIYEYCEIGSWLVVERCYPNEIAMQSIQKLVPCIDDDDLNAGLNQNGDLVIFDYGGCSYIPPKQLMAQNENN